ncbi:MAG: ABC transporter ATP-binding protein [Saprospiraceae bacterium]
MSSVIVKGISKTYAKEQVLALDNVSFEITEGTIFGLIGPDGAGKTTLFRILTTLILADEGEAWVDGSEVVTEYKSIRKKVGYMPGKFSLYQDLTVLENLQFFATIFGSKIEENMSLIHDIYIQIEPFKHRKAGQLSGGMKQKLALCCALIHEPKILFLDEPTTGVDPVSRKEFWDMLYSLKKKGITILVSTPHMDEAARCDQIALIQAGKIMAVNTPKQIISHYHGPLYQISTQKTYELLQDMKQIEQIDLVYVYGEFVHFTLKNKGINAIDSLKKYLQAKNHDATSIEAIEPEIEDCFIQLMTKQSA